MEDVAALTAAGARHRPREDDVRRRVSAFSAGRRAPTRLVTLSFGAPVLPRAPRRGGGAHSGELALHAVLEIDAVAMKKVVARALEGLPVIDLKVEDAPLEEVMADFFAQKGGGA